MAGIIFSLCSATALGCAVLLFRGYSRSKSRLLLWSSFCFIGLTISNLLLVVDRILFPSEFDLTPIRYSVTLGAMVLLIYGLIWESE